jgi:hypothetical protein
MIKYNECKRIPRDLPPEPLCRFSLSEAVLFKSKHSKGAIALITCKESTLGLRLHGCLRLVPAEACLFLTSHHLANG